MSHGHDPNTHSKLKLGAVGVIPILPMMPVACQAKSAVYAHYKLLGDAYVVGMLPSVSHERGPEVLEAIKAIPPMDLSYSGTGTLYRAFTIEPAPDGRTFTVKAGDVVIGIGYVDPDAPVDSTDGDGQGQGN